MQNIVFKFFKFIVIFFISILVIIGCLFLITTFSTISSRNELLASLEEYRLAINYIEKYYMEKDKYPDNIGVLNLRPQNFPYYTYKTLNKNKDFVLEVSKYTPEKFYLESYRYCSKIELLDCNPNNTNRYVQREQIESWVKIVYNEDD